MFQGFEDRLINVDGVDIFCRIKGQGAPVLLLHGFPQTHAMWAEVAQDLCQDHTVVCADLRGYGASDKPKGVENYSFRNMGKDQIGLMRALGFDQFHLVGHDRGGRTAHRMALDAPDAILSLTVMDIIPTQLLLDDLNKNVARAYYHWFFLAQPHPFPETLIASNPDYYYQSCLLGWGASQLGDFAPDQMAAYRTAWKDPNCIRAMCDDYRAAIDFDLALDQADLGRQVTCPALVLFGADGAMGKAYDVGATWADRLQTYTAQGIPGGHFFVDQHPKETGDALRAFFRTLC